MRPPWGEGWNRVAIAWLLLGVAALALTEGDLNARAAPSSVAEIDQVARTHNEMLHSPPELLRRERDFIASASHRLRTPLTGLQLALDAVLAGHRPGSRP